MLSLFFICGGYMTFEIDKINKKLAMFMYDEIINAVNRPNDIDLIIDSGGGALEYAVFIYEFLRNIQNRDIGSINVNAVVISKCFSAAMLIFAAAENRATYPSSTFMTHDASIGFNASNLKSIETALRSSAKHEEIGYKILAERSNENKTFWKESVSAYSEFYFDGRDALNYGLATEILE